MDIKVVDFDILYDCLEKAACVSDDVLLNIDKTGLSINSKNTIARLDIASNCVVAVKENSYQIALADIKLLLIALTNATESIKDRFGDTIQLLVRPGKLLIKTNNSKTSLHQANIDIIKSKSTEIKQLPKSVLDFTLNKNAFKKINSTFAFISNVNDIRVEFGAFAEDIQDKSLIGAKIFAADTPLSNYSVIDVGEINNQSVDFSNFSYPITIDIDRVNLLSKFTNNRFENVKMSALEKPAIIVNFNDNKVEPMINTKMTLVCSVVK